jgi:hypothetical protein
MDFYSLDDYSAYWRWFVRRWQMLDYFEVTIVSHFSIVSLFLVLDFILLIGINRKVKENLKKPDSDEANIPIFLGLIASELVILMCFILVTFTIK